MAGVSKNVLEAGEWCAPTKELENGQLLKLVHKSRKLIRETVQPLSIEAEGEVVMLVDAKLPAHEAPRFNAAGIPVYPVMRDHYRGLRIAIGTFVLAATAGVIALLVI